MNTTELADIGEPTTAPRQIHVHLNALGLIDNEASVVELTELLRRNASADCEISPHGLLRQLMDLASRELRNLHVWVGCLADGTELYFTGRLVPVNSTLVAALRAAGYRREPLGA